MTIYGDWQVGHQKPFRLQRNEFFAE